MRVCLGAVTGQVGWLFARILSSSFGGDQDAEGLGHLSRVTWEEARGNSNRESESLPNPALRNVRGCFSTQPAPPGAGGGALQAQLLTPWRAPGWGQVTKPDN